jgi:DNA-binding response OmpR family regulator
VTGERARLRLLLVEDDDESRRFVARYLTRRGYRVDEATTAADAWRSWEAHRADLLLIDLGLPDADGVSIIRRVRQEAATPIIVLSARDEERDKIAGLDAGADDYLTKPFAFRELLARVRALARRRPTPLPEVVKVADLDVDLRAHRVRRGGRSIELTAKEFALLEFLVRHCDQVVDRAAITAHVWDENHDPFTNVLEVLVRRLRRKIDEGFDVKLIHTLRGAGYRLGA